MFRHVTHSLQCTILNRHVTHYIVQCTIVFRHVSSHITYRTEIHVRAVEGEHIEGERELYVSDRCLRDVSVHVIHV